MGFNITHIRDTFVTDDDGRLSRTVRICPLRNWPRYYDSIAPEPKIAWDVEVSFFLLYARCIRPARCEGIFLTSDSSNLLYIFSIFRPLPLFVSHLYFPSSIASAYVRIMRRAPVMEPKDKDAVEGRRIDSAGISWQIHDAQGHVFASLS